MEKTHNAYPYKEELEHLLGCKIVGIVRSTDGAEQYLGLKIDNPIMEEGYILWFVNDNEFNGPGSFLVENYDTAEDFEEI
jgi:hypothetical protein